MNLPGVYQIFLDKWEKYQTAHIISDTHFKDEELIAGIAARPDDEAIIKCINSKVGRNDLLIHLGDVGDIETIKKIRGGYKILICGNHDVGHTKYLEVFDEVYSGPLMIGEKLILSHEPLDIDWAFNIHGHVHNKNHKNDATHKNVCLDVIDYTPINLNKFLKSGPSAKVISIHRDTIDKATKRSQKRKGQK